MRETLGNIFCDMPERLVIGKLVYERKYDHALVGFDVAVLVQACRETKHERLHACCIPYVNIEEPPFIHVDLQICGNKGKRTKCGWVFTQSDQRGPAYQVVIEKDIVLKQWGCVWCHGHKRSAEELQEEKKNEEDIHCNGVVGVDDGVRDEGS